MKLLQSRVTALLLAALVVVGSTVVSGSRGLSRACEERESAFFTDTQDAHAPGYYLNQHLSDAAALATVGEHYQGSADEADGLRAARKELAAAWDERDIEDLYSTNARLCDAVASLEAALAAETLSAEDAAALADRRYGFYGAERMLENSDYNSETAAFRLKVYSRFPAILLAGLAGVEPPELYQ